MGMGNRGVRCENGAKGGYGRGHGRIGAGECDKHLVAALPGGRGEVHQANEKFVAERIQPSNFDPDPTEPYNNMSMSTVPEDISPRSV